MAYLFSYFTVENQGGEQVYFAVSEDGLHWQDLSDQPALRSDLGEKGVRDPFMVKHPKTGMYYVLATDLCIDARKNDWDGAVKRGSRDLVFWQSMDLESWEEPWAVTLAPEGAGCAWAPEAIWDEEQQAFLIFFASYTQEGGEAKHRIYAAHTDDFHTFTPVFKYIEKAQGVIDTTIIRDGARYYRFSKNESNARIEADYAASLTGSFTPLHCPVLEEVPALEGPECYRLPDGRWCLMGDRFKLHTGYLPIVIDDLEKGEMHVLPDESFDFGGLLKRHGGVIAISQEEYDRLKGRIDR